MCSSALSCFGPFPPSTHCRQPPSLATPFLTFTIFGPYFTSDAAQEQSEVGKYVLFLMRCHFSRCRHENIATRCTPDKSVNRILILNLEEHQRRSRRRNVSPSVTDRHNRCSVGWVSSCVISFQKRTRT